MNTDGHRWKRTFHGDDALQWHYFECVRLAAAFLRGSLLLSSYFQPKSKGELPSPLLSIAPLITRVSYRCPSVSIGGSNSALHLPCAPCVPWLLYLHIPRHIRFPQPGVYPLLWVTRYPEKMNKPEPQAYHFIMRLGEANLADLDIHRHSRGDGNPGCYRNDYVHLRGPVGLLNNAMGRGERSGPSIPPSFPWRRESSGP